MATGEKRQQTIKDGFYYLDIGYVCGGIEIKDGRVIKCAPIFNKMKTWGIDNIVKSMRKYDAVFIGR